MTTNPFGRVITAMVTPMRPDGSVDEGGLRAVVEHLLASGHDGLVVNGTTGESATLTDDESIDAVRLAKEVAGDRAAVTAGVGSNSTAHSIEMAARAAEAGADALLLVSPYYNKPTQAGLLAHCRAVAEYAFREARRMGGKVYGGPKWTVSPVYEGMLKEEMDAAAERHPDVAYEPVLIDATLAGLVSGAADAPLVIPCLNRDGDLLSDLVLPMFGSIAGAESIT